MSDSSAAPKFENAPGVVARARKVGWVVFWQARNEFVEKGFRPRTVPLWRGFEPSRLDRAYIADQCVRLQNEMLTFGRGGVPEISTYTGTVTSLIACYKTDPDSGYQSIRYQSRVNYDSMCRRLERDLGSLRLEDIDARLIKRTHEEWTAGGKIAMAHSLVAMLRTLCTFGATMLKSKECRALRVDLHDMKFKMPKQRDETLSAEQAIAVITKAHDMNLSEIALAQAIQFECMLRQKDVIGEWVPDKEPGLSDVTYAGQKWLMGIRWSEIDGDLILRHVTSKRLKPVEVDLRQAPLVLREFKSLYGLDLARGLDRALLPSTGPVVVYRENGRPFHSHQFRRLWRKVADFAGVPKNTRNMDSRAGAITEATEAGADLEHIKHAATHSNIAMTQRYARGGVKKAAGVLKMRVAHRENKT